MTLSPLLMLPGFASLQISNKGLIRWLARTIPAGMLALLLALPGSMAQAQARSFSFGVIGQAERAGSGAQALRNALEESGRERLMFVVVNGLKSSSEPCTDRLYTERRELLDEARQTVIVSLGAGDWARCRRDDGSSAAIDRLARVREIFFTEASSAAQSTSFNLADPTSSELTITRQSATVQFRDYAENMRWHTGGVLFATINLPGNNNNYIADAGRNSEFEDRIIANRFWMQRLARAAKQKKARALVLFVDGDPLLQAKARKSALGGRSDGYADFRRHLRELTSHYTGRVLLVHNAQGRSVTTTLNWRGNFGEMILGTGWTQVTVGPRATFSIKPGA